MQVEAIIASLDGKTLLRDSIRGLPEEAVNLGKTLGNRMLANGGKEILAAIL